MCKCIKIHKEDDVVVLLADGVLGESIQIDSTEIKLLQDTPKGHKIAVKEIAKNKDVLKYGYSIGKAKEDIKVGEWVHLSLIHI